MFIVIKKSQTFLADKKSKEPDIEKCGYWESKSENKAGNIGVDLLFY